MIESARFLRGALDLDCDDVIIGSGAGGAVTAAVLAEAGRRVIVLEEGPAVPTAQQGEFRQSETLRHLFRHGGLDATIPLGDSPAINLTLGRGVGGSSLLTGGVCFRIPGSVLQHWERDLGLSRFTERSWDTHFDAIERELGVATVPDTLRSEATRLFGQGVNDRFGVTLEPMRRNMTGCQGLSRCNFGCPANAKMSVAHTYLPRAERSGAQIVADCLVERIQLSGDRATLVSGRILNGPNTRPQDRLRVRAKRVIVAAGGVHSPQLLARSGVRSEHLGANLTLHPSFRVMARFEHDVQGHIGAMQSAFSDAFMAEHITLVSVFVPPGVLAATTPGAGDAFMQRTGHLRNLAMFGMLIHDDGGGAVWPGLGREPFIAYRMSRKDRRALSRGLRIMGDSFFAAGAKEIVLPVLGAEPYTADAFAALELDRIPGTRFESASQHPLGTCRIGYSEDDGVIDASGKVFGLQNVWVADGSVLPTSLGVNPQIGIMAMAHRIAHGLRDAA